MRWFYNLKTMTKLILGFAVVCTITAGMGWLGGTALMRLRENLRIVYADYTTAATDLARSSSNLMRYRNCGVLSTGAKSRDEFERLVAEQQELGKKMTAALDAYAATVLRVSRSGRNEEQDLTAYRTALKGYLEAADGTVNLSRQVWEAKTEEERAELRAKAAAWAVEQSGPKLNAAIAAFDHLVGTVIEVAKDMNDDGKATAESSLWMMLIGTIAAIVISLGLGYFIARIVSRPLAQAVEILNTVAGGDFTQSLDVNTKDEVGQMAQALNNAVSGVRHALMEVRDVADAVASAAPQLSAASEEISSGAQEQASNLEETASSLEEITSTVKQNADNAQQANQLACRSREVAEKGGQVVANAVEGMNEINKASKKIADIITAIDEIAFQTNLLALNAAVEAARAGEQGRGFAVVAGEVRNLAQRSAAAAKEIKGLIQDSVRKVETGAQLVNQSGETLHEIVTSVKRVTDIVAEIAAASREQSAGIEQVSRAVAQMDQVTQGNASQTEELSGTAESLAGQAQQLQTLVSKFALGNETVKPTTHTPVRTAVVAEPAPTARPKAKAAAPQHNGWKDDHDAHNSELVGAGNNGHNRLNGTFEEF